MVSMIKHLYHVAHSRSVQRRNDIRQGVAMNRAYVDAILVIPGEDPTIKRDAIFKLLLQKVSMDEANLPPNFPSVE